MYKCTCTKFSSNFDVLCTNVQACTNIQPKYTCYFTMFSSEIFSKFWKNQKKLSQFSSMHSGVFLQKSVNLEKKIKNQDFVWKVEIKSL